jgi:hypothetical protein
MQNKLWIRKNKTISFVDKLPTLSTTPSTENKGLSTKVYGVTIDNNYFKPLNIPEQKQSGFSSIYKKGFKSVLKANNSPTHKSTNSTSITTYYIYNIKLKGYVENI